MTELNSEKDCRSQKVTEEDIKLFLEKCFTPEEIQLMRSIDWEEVNGTLCRIVDSLERTIKCTHDMIARIEKIGTSEGQTPDNGGD